MSFSLLLSLDFLDVLVEALSGIFDSLFGEVEKAAIEQDEKD